MKFNLCAPVLVLVLVVTVAADKGVRRAVKLEDCRAAPTAMIDALDPSWQSWRKFIHLCPVFALDGRRVLSVITIRVDLIQVARVPLPDPPRPFPNAIILDPQGRVLGELPSVFPDGLPADTRLVFTDWRAGFPYRVEMRELHAGVLGTFDRPPLVWNPVRQQFQTVKQ